MAKRTLKVYICSLILVAFMSGIAFSAENKFSAKNLPPEVLGVRFSVTKEELKAKYIPVSEEYEDDETLGYRELLVDMEGANSIAYGFNKNKLYSIYVMLTSSSTMDSAQDVITVYNKYKESLTNKYGTPEVNEVIDPDFDTADFRLIAFQTGQGKYESQWAKDDLKIKLVLSGENNKLDFVLIYGYKPIVEEVVKEKQAEQKKFEDNL